MSLAVVYSRANVGIRAPLIEVEVHLSPGLPSLSIVGLPEAVVKESKDRVRSAIINSHFEFPAKRITINLAPADLPKEGGRYDLPIAIGILAATAQIPPTALVNYEFGGELALSGELRAFAGVLPMMMAARDASRSIILPTQNAAEGGRVKGLTVFPAPNLLSVCQHLLGSKLLAPQTETVEKQNSANILDLSEVQGQYQAKFALEIAAAGGHSLLMRGPPGSGKTMLANRLIGILPDLSEQEALEIAAIHSLYGRQTANGYYAQRPFRAPHHTASSVALVGGGKYPKPGEVSLAHHGVLFLDELPEFSRSSLEALREPLEAGTVTIARAAYSIEFPARFQLIAAMNPCPCGYWGELGERCICGPQQVQRYQKRLSGPFIDRIDLQVALSAVSPHLLLAAKPVHPIGSAAVKQRVKHARQWQLERAGCLNASMSQQILQRHCQLQVTEQAYLHEAMHKFGFSARSYHRLLQVARTIADLAQCENIKVEHLQQALVFKKT